jgi:hypothetical protein
MAPSPWVDSFVTQSAEAQRGAFTSICLGVEPVTHRRATLA